MTEQKEEDKIKSNKEINKVEKVQLKITKEIVENLSDEELDKVTGGISNADASIKTQTDTPEDSETNATCNNADFIARR